MKRTVIKGKMKMLVLPVLTLLMCTLYGSLAHADVAMGGQHQLISSVDNGNGTHSISISVFVVNNSTDSYSSVTLIPLHNKQMLLASENTTVQIDNLPANASVEAVWNVVSMMPGEALAGSRHLMFIGQAIDALGEMVGISVISDYPSIQ